jgi:putative transposase
VSLEQRQLTISIIDQARAEGARLNSACECAEIDAATYRRWQYEGKVLADRRATAIRPTPVTKLTSDE